MYLQIWNACVYEKKNVKIFYQEKAFFSQKQKNMKRNIRCGHHTVW
jgi:hypothetical protein